jgi:hypothetical protein
MSEVHQKLQGAPNYETFLWGGGGEERKRLELITLCFTPDQFASSPSDPKGLKLSDEDNSWSSFCFVCHNHPPPCKVSSKFYRIFSSKNAHTHKGYLKLPLIAKCSLHQWYSNFFVRVPLRYIFSATLYPQNCWYIIQVIHSAQSTSKINQINYIQNNVLNNKF